MPFINNVKELNSLSIIGTAKNAGKTETLNYLLRRLRERYPSKVVGVTSIGIDGERRDQVTLTDKPEIIFEKGMLFVTAEQFYRQKRLPAEVLEVEREYTTSIGKLILSRARGTGKALIAGPPSTGGLRKVIAHMNMWGADLSIIDGALSRVSLASPSVADGLILATGASYSAQPEVLIKKTKELFQLIQLPELDDRTIANELEQIDYGIRILTDDNEVIDTGVVSALLTDLWEDTRWMKRGGSMFVPGVVNDRLIEKLRVAKRFDKLIVKDFTRVFASGATLNKFLASGKQLLCLNKSQLIAITFNPQSPSGYRLDSIEMCRRLQEVIGVPVYDVRKL